MLTIVDVILKLGSNGQVILRVHKQIIELSLDGLVVQVLGRGKEMELFEDINKMKFTGHIHTEMENVVKLNIELSNGSYISAATLDIQLLLLKHHSLLLLLILQLADSSDHSLVINLELS